VNHELRNRSSVGVIFVNRTATGAGVGTDNWNRMVGVDASLGIREWEPHATFESYWGFDEFRERSPSTSTAGSISRTATRSHRRRSTSI